MSRLLFIIAAATTVAYTLCGSQAIQDVINTMHAFAVHTPSF